MLLALFNHLTPVVITLLIAFGIYFFQKGKSYTHFIALVEKADTKEGQIAFAKYLARKAGGRSINVDRTWRGFMGAAQEIRQVHLDKQEERFYGK